MLPAQLASEYVIKVGLLFLVRWIPWKTACFKYKSLFFAVQWFVVGFFINWGNLLIANEMSGQVKDKYCNLPIIFQNYVLSTARMPSLSFIVWLVERKVETCLAPLIFVFERRSCIYLCWDKKRYTLVGITSTPRKKCRMPISLRENLSLSFLMIECTNCGVLPVITRSSK